ncbi:YraN family protein [Bdellovibrionota bacterium FG-2]
MRAVLVGMSSTREIGSQFEAQALEWLVSRNPGGLLKPIAQNFSVRGGELDLVFEQWLATGELELVVVEVRARQQGSWVDGLESVDGVKQRKLRRALAAFLLRYEGLAQSIRIDVMAWDGRSWSHVQNAVCL